MWLERLGVRDLRIIQETQIEPASGINLIFGENASGKTSLLEAIHFLSRGRSFKGRAGDHLLRHGCEEILVTGRVQSDLEGGQAIPIGIARTRGAGLQARVAGCNAKGIAELAARLPVLALHPESQELLTGGPSLRRSFLDWGCFYLTETFLPAWRRYQRALAQRNAALRNAAPDLLVNAWNEEMSLTAVCIDEARTNLVDRLSGPLADRLDLLGIDRGTVDLAYRRGWREGTLLGESLEQGVGRDRRRGFTQDGPHRAEMDILFEGQPAAPFISRGQGKLLTTALLLALGEVHAQATGTRGVLLLDDLHSEFDGRHTESMARLLSAIPVQVFVTSTRPEGVPGLDVSRVFHVEQGRVREVV